MISLAGSKGLITFKSMRAVPYGILAFVSMALAFWLQAHMETAPAQVSFSIPEQAGEATKHELGLRIRLISEHTGRPIPGCIRIRVAGSPPGPWLQLDPLLPRGLGLKENVRDLGWHVLAEEAETAIPGFRIEIEAYSGIRFERRSLEVDPSALDGSRLDIALQPLFDPAADGWVAGNTHLHLRRIDRETADRYLVDVCRAEGLEVVFVSYLERAVEDLEYISNDYRPIDLERLSTSHLVFGPGEEYRHNFGSGGQGYGHVLFLDLARPILPASIGPGITDQGKDDIPLRPAIRRARDLEATTVWCHNQFGFEDIPSWIDGLIDALNIFDGGSRGTYEETFYQYLNLGLKVPFSTGTDWFINDHARVYVRMDRKDLSDRGRWLAGLRRGETFITNGAWLEFSVDQTGPGEEINLERPQTVKLQGRAISRHDFGTLEVVHNGRVIHAVPASKRQEGPGFEAAIRNWAIRVAGPGWMALRIRPPPETLTEMGRPLFGHTGPVYIRFGGNLHYDPDAADHLVRELRRYQDLVRKQGVFSHPSELESILSIYQSAVSSITDRDLTGSN